MENQQREALPEVIRQFQNAHNRVLYRAMQAELAQDRDPTERALADGLLKEFPLMHPQIADAEAGRYLTVMREFSRQVVEAALKLEAADAATEGRIRLQRAEIFRNHFVDDVAVQRQSGSAVVDDLAEYVPAMRNRDYYMNCFLRDQFMAGVKTPSKLADAVLARDRSVDAEQVWGEVCGFLGDVRNYAIYPVREI